MVHVYISSAMNELGNVLEALGKLDQAEKMYLESLDMEYTIHGQNVVHVDIAITLHNLGVVFQAQGNIALPRKPTGRLSTWST